MECCVLDTPTGPFALYEQDGAITRAGWHMPDNPAPTDSAVMARAKSQIRAYFNHELTQFDLPLHVGGSDFQRAVCVAMSAIPLGETRTYGDLAALLGNSAQAVGNACGGNPIPLIIPCHRVLGATGLGGFSGTGGVETKVALLRHEGAAGLLI